MRLTARILHSFHTHPLPPSYTQHRIAITSFMDSETFEEKAVNRQIVDDKEKWIAEGYGSESCLLQGSNH
jgi:translation elongation factor P/translation initiation factor 5A